ncbi:MAG TPA: hypothetical protein VFX49_01155 [Chloroflexota bacterium]|nr:hypothetical protein [Chloroflexota bacterium]
MIEQAGGGEAWVRCPSCLRMWPRAQLRQIHDVDGRRLCCPDWECDAGPSWEPQHDVALDTLIATFSTGQRHIVLAPPALALGPSRSS